jgi:hypothetical protein
MKSTGIKNIDILFRLTLLLTGCFYIYWHTCCYIYLYWNTRCYLYWHTCCYLYWHTCCYLYWHTCCYLYFLPSSFDCNKTSAFPDKNIHRRLDVFRTDSVWSASPSKSLRREISAFLMASTRGLYRFVSRYGWIVSA